MPRPPAMRSNKKSAGSYHPEKIQDDDDANDGEAPFRSQSEGDDPSEDDSDGMEENNNYGEASERAGKPCDKVVGKAISESDAANLRKEKRLAMNRASARARRKRKKVSSDSLADQVRELTKRNHTLQLTNKSLLRKVDHLESALVQAQATIASLVATVDPGEASRRQHHGGFTQPIAATPLQQEDLHTLLQAGTPSGASTLSSVLGGLRNGQNDIGLLQAATPSGASTLSSVLGGLRNGQNDIGLLQAATPSGASTLSSVLGGLRNGQNDIGLLQQAHFLLQGQGQTRSQLLEAAALGLRLHPEQHGGLVTSPSGSFLDQSRHHFQQQQLQQHLQQLRRPQSMPLGWNGVNSQSGSGGDITSAQVEARYQRRKKKITPPTSD